MLQERAHLYAYRFANVANTPGVQQLGGVMQADSDAPFRLYGVAVFVYDGTNGLATVRLRFSRPDGSFIQKNLIPGNALVPFDTGITTGSHGGDPASFLYFAPVSPNLLYAPRSAITVDIESPGVNEADLVQVIFLGTKLFEPGRVWRPDLPKTYTSIPFLSYPVQIVKSLLPVNNIPLQILADAGFIWQTGQSSGYSTGDTAPTLGVKIKDWTGKYYMNDYIPIDLLFGFDNAQIPGFPYPEIYIPRQQALFIDAVSFGTGPPPPPGGDYVNTLCFKGQKIYG